MFLSIIIPIYNDEKYLEECLDSCLNQDIPHDNYEIICIDDGSTDSTPAILEDYKNKYSNVIVITKKHGVGIGRNMGMEYSTGDYLWFVDHDDFIKRNCLSIIKNELEKTNCDRLIIPAYTFHDHLSKEEEMLRRDNAIVDNHSKYADNVVWQSILKKSFLDEHMILTVPIELVGKPMVASDTYFISEIWRNGATEARLDSVPLYYYRVHANSDSHRKKNYSIRVEGLINDACEARKSYLKEKDELGETSARTAIHYVRWVRQCSSSIALMPHEYYKLGRKRMKEEGLMPFTIPPEATFRYKDWIKNHNYKKIIANTLHYYSIEPVGMTLYRYWNIKVHLSRFIKQRKKKN